MNRVIIDLETTGLDSKNDKIIEIGAVRVESDGKRSEFHALIDPECSLPHEITELTGITEEMLIGQSTMEHIAGELIAFMEDAVPIAHNASFEAGFLRKYTGYETEDWLDTILLTKIAFPNLGSYSLANIVKELDLLNEEPHRALADARGTELLFEAIDKKFAAMDKGVLGALVEILGKSHPLYADFFRQYAPFLLSPCFLPPKQNGEKQGEQQSPNEFYQIELSRIEEILNGDNGLKKVSPRFKSRQSQIDMALKVGESFNEGNFLLAEAGTGTGKTIAYLIPSALLALEGGSKVLISTHTIHLQDQIINKDIPDINQIFEGKLRSALVKGRTHYLCHRKWVSAFNNAEEEQPLFLSRLLTWVTETEDGDVDVLNLNSMERKEWQKLAATSDTCLRGHCPYYHNECFVRRTRKRAENAHFVVVNHSLLLADSMIESGILPPTDFLVIDEAHQLDKVAEESLGFTFHFFDHITLMGDTKKMLQKMYKLAAFPGMFAKEEELAAAKEKQDFVETLLTNFDEKAAKGDQMFLALRECYSECHESRNPMSKSWRIEKNVRFHPLWKETETLIENYQIWLNELSVAMKKVIGIFDEDLNGEGMEKDKFQIIFLQSTLNEAADSFHAFLNSDAENMVAWLEQGGERMIYPVLRLAPIKVNELLAERLFTRKESIIFVSATLSVNNKFQYFIENCGLNLAEKHCDELLLPSSFDYVGHCRLVAVSDVKNIGEVSEYEFLDSISSAIVELTKASRGRALVLFTSHVQLREVYRRIEEPLKAASIDVLAHELSGNRSHLLEKIREKKKTVILGANSFWEGIDISGENLSLLIIVKLPFWPPDMPILAAKMEKMEEEHRNSFAELSLPQAIIRFKQGFGRLLRNEKDKGIVCILDRRIYEKRYGKQFINSLPVKKLYRLPVKDIADFMKEKL